MVLLVSIFLGNLLKWFQKLQENREYLFPRYYLEEGNHFLEEGIHVRLIGFLLSLLSDPEHNK